MKAPSRPSSKMKQAPAVPRSELNVKLYFQQNWKRDVRVFQTEHRADYRKFCKQVKQVLRVRDSEHILLKWRDDTGDLITLSSDSEMQLATRHIRHSDVLNICVQLQEEVSAPTLCDKCDQTIICNIRYKCDTCVNFVCCVRCYQAAAVKPQIHEHELYKEKYPCYCPMHRTSETEVSFSHDHIRASRDHRPVSAIPPRVLRQLGYIPVSDGRSASTPPHVYNRQASSGSSRNGYMGGSSGGYMGGSTGGYDSDPDCSRRDSMDDLMRGLNPSVPSYEDVLPEEHNYRTAERQEIVRGPDGEVYNRHQMSVFQNPASGVVAIRSKRSRETRSKSNQLG